MIYEKSRGRKTRTSATNTNSNSSTNDDDHAILSLYGIDTSPLPSIDNDSDEDSDITNTSTNQSNDYNDTKQKILKKLRKKVNKKLVHNKIESMAATAIQHWQRRCSSSPDEVMKHCLMVQPRNGKQSKDNDGVLWNSLLAQIPNIEWSDRMCMGLVTGLFDFAISSEKSSKNRLKLINTLKLVELKILSKINEDLLFITPNSIVTFLVQHIDASHSDLSHLYDYYIKNRERLLSRIYSRGELRITPLLRLPLYQLIQIKAICPWELYGQCNNNTCLENTNIMHQVCIICGKEHSTSICPLNKARRGRRRGRGRGRGRTQNRQQYNNNTHTQHNYI